MIKSLVLCLFCVGCAGGSAVVQGPSHVLPGDPAVDASRFPLGVDSSRVVFLRNGEERAGPLQVEQLQLAEEDGRRVLRQVITLSTPRGTLNDTTVYEYPSLVPLRHRSHTSWRNLFLDYTGGRVQGVKTVPDSADTRIDVRMDPRAFDPGASNLVIQALPLREGYTARIPFFNHERLEVLQNEIRVTGSEEVEVDGEAVAAWVVRVDVWDGRVVTHRIAKEDRRLLDTEAPLPDGSVMRIRPVAQAEPSPRISAYLDEALDVIRENALFRDSMEGDAPDTGWNG